MPNLPALLVFTFFYAQAPAQTPIAPRDWYTRGQQAFARHQIDSALIFYARAATTQRSERDDTTRALALRKVATLQWRFFQDTARARAALDQMAGIGLFRTQAHVERSRMLRAQQHYTLAYSSALIAVRHVQDRSHRVVAATAVAGALTDALLQSALLPDAGACEICTVQHAAEALSYLEPIVREESGQLEPSRQLLRLALAVGKGELALHAFRSYYLLGTDDTSAGPLAAPRRALAALLPAWRPADESAGKRAELIHALARARLFTEALLVAALPLRRPAPFDAEARDALLYARFLVDLERQTDEYYRQVAIGHTERTGAFASLYEERARAFWPQLIWNTRAPAFSVDSFNVEVARRFGAHMTLGITAGYADLHYGHRVVDDRRSIEQYGQRADFRFVQLDGLASNGFQSWAWDGASAHGGWSTGTDLVVQVRPSYAQTPLRVWREVADSAVLAAELRTIATDSAADLFRAQAQPGTYLPGLAVRIHRDGRNALMSELAARGHTGSALREAFITSFAGALTESAIFAHEGRHAIDARLIPHSDAAEREFRAKLSEVVFAKYPRLALNSIISPNSGDATPHGRANARVMAGLVTWMRTHASRIPNLDARVPLLPQLTRLSDAQLREAFQSMDPLAQQ